MEHYPNWTKSEFGQMSCVLDLVGVPLEMMVVFVPADTDPQFFLEGIRPDFEETGPAAVAQYDDCTCEGYHVPGELTTRYYMTAVFGSCMAALSACFNSFVFYILVSSRKHRDSHFMYLIFLAVIDVIIAATYIPFIAGLLHLWFYRSVFLLGLWSSVSVGMLTASHVAMTSASYLILTATFERFLLTAKSPLQPKMRRFRLLWCAMCLFCGVLSKGGIWLEMSTTRHPYCENMAKFSTGPTPLVTRGSEEYSWFYAVVYKFFIRNICSVFVPFVTLFGLNGLILYTLRKQQRTARLFRLAAADSKATEAIKKRVRSATNLLLCVAFTYLVSNVLAVVVTMWEFIDINSIIQLTRFYSLAQDLISIGTLIAGILRLPIYVTCVEDVRNDVLNWFAHFECCCLRSDIEPVVALSYRRPSDWHNGPPVDDPDAVPELKFRNKIDNAIEQGNEFDKMAIWVAMVTQPVTKTKAQKYKQYNQKYGATIQPYFS